MPSFDCKTTLRKLFVRPFYFVGISFMKHVCVPASKGITSCTKCKVQTRNSQVPKNICSRSVRGNNWMYISIPVHLRVLPLFIWTRATS